MPKVSLENLNKNFASDFLTFKEGPDGFVYADIQNDSGSAQVFLHGAQVTSYIPKGEPQLLFLSPKSLFEPGKAIRGGIPISWPWFADHPTDREKPAHGFARTTEWEVRETNTLSDGDTNIILGLSDNEHSRKLWDYSFDLEVAIQVDDELGLIITTTNTDNKNFTITQAFHSYFRVGDVNEISIRGLENTEFIDKVDNFITKKQLGSVTITDETDRIYIDTTNDCEICGQLLNRKTRIRKSGSNSTVVWNPWKEKAQSMKDLGDSDYRKFVCLEATNAGSDIVEVAPGEKYLLGLNISTEKI